MYLRSGQSTYGGNPGHFAQNNLYRFTQNHTGALFQNLSTVATFFSAVAATTLQYTYGDHSSHTQVAVNLLWVISLVFSLASAINSQLANHWRQSAFRSPRSRVPWWVYIWITRTPLIFLISSVVAFSAGLVCFTFSVFGGTVIPIVTTVCTSFTYFVLLAVGIWSAGERYTFSRTGGKRWLTDLLQEAIRNPKRRPGISWFSIRSFKIIENVFNLLKKLRDFVYPITSELYQFASSAFATLFGVGSGANAGLAQDSLPLTDPSHVTSPFTPSGTAPHAPPGPDVAILPTGTPVSDLGEGDGSLSVPGTEVHSLSAATVNFRTLVGRVIQLNRELSRDTNQCESNSLRGSFVLPFKNSDAPKVSICSRIAD